MPERPKRRKNNKNKRKNKNNKPDSSKSNSDLRECDNSETSSIQNDCVDESLEPQEEIAVSGELSSEKQITDTKTSLISSLPLVDLNQDLNNNSDVQNIQPLCDLPVDSPDDITLTGVVEIRETTNYVVESPEQSLKTKPKLSKTVKSKSLDNEDEPKIIEVTEDILPSDDENNLPVVNVSNVIITDVESDVEWEKTDELDSAKTPHNNEPAVGTLSITTIPLNVAQCEQTKSLTPEEEISLRNYLKTLNLSTNPENANSIEIKQEIEQIINREIRQRLRKKGLAEDFLLPRVNVPRILDVIDEESSESSMTSRRQSYLSDKKSDNEDLEDDVFEDKVKLDEKVSSKSFKNVQNKTFGRLVPQQCVLVGTKIREPEVSEARGDWTVKTVEKMTGAEVVYLTDSSSSTSSIHELYDDTDDGVETDVSIRMITPTIEVTDTENLLKKTFVSEDNRKITDNGDDVVKDGTTGKEHIINVVYEKEVENNDTNQTQVNPVQEHEIVVLCSESIKTDLYVKDLDEVNQSQNSQVDDNLQKLELQDDSPKSSKINNKYDLEIKVLKCELNDAINNLIKEVSDSEIKETSKEEFTRQDSSSSVGSSQCTAKYNPDYSSLNDVSNILHDEPSESNTAKSDAIQKSESASHVKDVFQHVTGTSTENKYIVDIKHPLPLRDICVSKIASFPYGDKILEELASVSKRLQDLTAYSKIITEESNIYNTKENSQKERDMPYFPLPDLSSIDKITLSTKINDAPPPVQPRNSSLKKTQDDDHWTGIPTKSEPVYVCLSPSQKMLMEKTNTVITQEDASHLVDMHKKFIDRRGYDERHGKIENDNVSPVVPFKSQTGSRLLALIRDPTVTGNLHSTKNYNTLSDQQQNKYSLTETMQSKKTAGGASNISPGFKPIPPPRPKKLSSCIYESDESSDFTDNSLRSMKSERKYFHYSTGNLSKEIEKDISSIQNMHRFYTDMRSQVVDNPPRRPSLPKDLCEQQMEYIRQKEKEVEAEIKRLEAMKNDVSILQQQRKGPRAPLLSEKDTVDDRNEGSNFHMPRTKDFHYITKDSDKKEKHEKGKLSSLFSSSQEEILREKMYSEYISQMAERQERKQHKVIKITNPLVSNNKAISKSTSALNFLDSQVNNKIEKEFISRARERWNKLGIKDPETEDERESNKDVYREPKVIEHKIKVIAGGEEKDVKKLPSHLQEFVRFTAKDKSKDEPGSDSSETVMITPTFKARSTSPAVWRPGAPTPPPAPQAERSPAGPPPPPPPPVWTPGASPQTPRKTFRPVHFEETPPSRRKFPNSEQNGCTSGSESEGRLRTSQSAPATGLNSLGASASSSRLPRAQNPTVTLLQKAREGQISRGYLQLEKERERDSVRLPRDRPSPPKGDPVHALRQEYASEAETDRSDYERGGTRKMADAHRKVEGIGPTTKDGMPVALRSEVKDPSRWYKKMYDTIHKNKYDDDYVTIRYKSRRGQPPERVSSSKSQYAYFDPRSGYLSEPEGGLSRLASSTWSDAYDSDVTTGPRRRTASVQEDRRINETMTPYMPSNKYSTLASGRASHEVYKTQPGRIEDYVPGRSSVIDKEAKQWWDEVMDIFDGQNVSSTTSLPQASPKEKKDITSTILSKSNMARALKESGYESDSTLVFRRRDETEAPLSPAERRAAYRELQAGGEPPLRGFRSPAPPRQESPRRYVESDVNIHYRCPVRHDPLPLVPERELARQQAEHMKRLYREQRRNKYLQELQDMQNRRHQDNFTPSQKNILPLNRYDEAEKVIAKALYAFNGQTPRELSFRKGEIIHVRRQIDSNWYEGEIHGRIGLFPYNYVEIQKGDAVNAPKKPSVVEGRARAKFDFTAQTNLELPLKKGEIVVLTRRIDQNWWEGRNGVKTGIFPDSYVTVLQEPSQSKPEPQPILSTDKPVASPAAHGLLNGSAKRSMGSHSYTPTPNNPALSNAPQPTQPLTGYAAKPAQASLTPSERGYGPPTGQGVDLNNTEPLYVDTNAEAVPYRAMYKYRPQNPDELELNEGDTVYVLEKCDDGWYVGSSQRTGRFGTFPGNYVERI